MPEEIRRLVFEKPDILVGEWSHSSTAAFTIADLWPTSDTSQLERMCNDVLAKNTKQVEDYRAGKEQAFNSLVGQVMKATKGKANPAQVNEILKRKLAG
jgi:aspartyl-tRNA(Asn)/glutamyl-tRNA(Gln) amidotransferase subunit B